MLVLWYFRSILVSAWTKSSRCWLQGLYIIYGGFFAPTSDWCRKFVSSPWLPNTFFVLSFLIVVRTMSSRIFVTSAQNVSFIAALSFSLGPDKIIVFIFSFNWVFIFTLMLLSEYCSHFSINFVVFFFSSLARSFFFSSCLLHQLLFLMQAFPHFHFLPARSDVSFILSALFLLPDSLFLDLTLSITV